jgi:hypothetical protein
MCNAAAIGSVAMSGISTGMQYSEQSEAASELEAWGHKNYTAQLGYRRELDEFQLSQFIEGSESAIASAKQNYQEIFKRIDQESQVAGLEIQELGKQSAQAQASAVAAAAERGVTGSSVDALMNSIVRNELASVENVRVGLKWELDVLAGQKDEIEAMTRSRINQMVPGPIPMPALPRPVQKPNAMAAFMNFGAQAMAYAAEFYEAPAPSGAPQATTGGPMNVGRSNLYNTGGVSQGSYGPMGGFQQYSARPSWAGG